MVKWFVKSIHRVDSGKTTNQCLNKLIPSGVWEEIEETQSSVEIQVFDRRNVCMSPLLYRKRTQPSEFLYLAILRELLVVFSRAAQTIAWIWMSRRAHPSFYFLRCNWKRSHVCQKLCLDNTVHPLVPSCTFSPFKYISFERILKINFLPSWNAQVNRISNLLKFLLFYLNLLFIRRQIQTINSVNLCILLSIFTMYEFKNITLSRKQIHMLKISSNY